MAGSKKARTDRQWSVRQAPRGDQDVLQRQRVWVGDPPNPSDADELVDRVAAAMAAGGQPLEDPLSEKNRRLLLGHLLHEQRGGIA